MGVHISFSINITASEVLPPKWPLVFLSSWCTKLGAPKWAKKSVRYREIYRRDTISRYQSQKFGMWIQLTSRYIVSCDIAWYGIWYHDIYRDTMSHWITSKHQANTNSTKTHHLVAVYSCFFRLCLCPHLGLSSVWPFSSSFCCPSDGHIIGLTVPPANSKLVPSKLGLLPDRVRLLMFHVSILISFVFFLSLSFFLPDTWYLVLLSCCEVPDIVMLT